MSDCDGQVVKDSESSLDFVSLINGVSDQLETAVDNMAEQRKSCISAESDIKTELNDANHEERETEEDNKMDEENWATWPIRARDEGTDGIAAWQH